ncbi:MAG: dinitrogenase iron-molybdenum cofactor biosynthesis protein [Pseudomonadota bacterium]
MKRILIPLWGDDIAPRFDAAQEVTIVAMDEHDGMVEKRTVILPEASAEALCNLVLSERIDMVVCCAIEEEYYQYLTWKRVAVIDSVAGPLNAILERIAAGSLQQGDMLFPR